MDITKYIKEVALLTERKLEELIPDAGDQLSSVMRYSLFAGGKRIRPALIMASYEACGGKYADDNVLVACAAIEMFHTFSLMHDDLPSMDDDNFRRGKPTAHKAYSEALAILGGDALSVLAFEFLSDLDNMKVIKEIAYALGPCGMIGGQVIDIESEGKSINKETLEKIHFCKTGQLIIASIKIGSILANATDEVVKNLCIYGKNIGIVFQVVDDILDEEKSTAQLGKDSGSDKINGKATFPSILGMEESKKYAETLTTQAIERLDFLGEKATNLKNIALFIKNRIN